VILYIISLPKDANQNMNSTFYGNSLS